MTARRPKPCDEYTPQQRRRIDAELDKAAKGPFHGPFETVDEMIAHIKGELGARAGESQGRSRPSRIPQRMNLPCEIREPTTPRSTRDNGRMPMVPSGYVHQGHLDALIKDTRDSLGPEVVHVAYSIGPDSTGEPSIFFRILLADAYIREDTIADLTGRIGAILLDSVRPVENWGLRPYFNFRSKSEQDQRRDPDWA